MYYVKDITESCVRHCIIVVLVFPHYNFCWNVCFRMPIHIVGNREVYSWPESWRHIWCTVIDPNPNHYHIWTDGYVSLRTWSSNWKCKSCKLSFQVKIECIAPLTNLLFYQSIHSFSTHICILASTSAAILRDLTWLMKNETIFQFL